MNERSGRNGEAGDIVIERAIALMRQALRLLDTVPADTGGADGHLQMAIDAACGARPMGEGETLANESLSLDLLPLDMALVRAMGGALSMIATLLGRQGIVETGEVANLLGIYAVATGETDDAEGKILGCWAAMIRDVAEQQGKAVRG
jgi:hypothetical protein